MNEDTTLQSHAVIQVYESTIETSVKFCGFTKLYSCSFLTNHEKGLRFKVSLDKCLLKSPVQTLKLLEGSTA